MTSKNLRISISSSTYKIIHISFQYFFTHQSEILFLLKITFLKREKEGILHVYWDGSQTINKRYWCTSIYNRKIEVSIYGIVLLTC